MSATAASLPHPAAEPLGRVVSLGGQGGGGRECLLAQRLAGLSPIGLLDQAEMPDATLVQLLTTRFAGIGGPRNVLVGPWPNSDEWWTRDPRFPLAIRSGIRRADRRLEGLTRPIRLRLQFLLTRLLEALDAGQPLLVFRSLAEPPAGPVLNQLFNALGRYPGARLLYVHTPEPGQPAGMVRSWTPRLLLGSLPPPADPDNPDVAAWGSLCAAALVSGQRAAEPVIAQPVPTKAATPPDTPAQANGSTVALASEPPMVTKPAATSTPTEPPRGPADPDIEAARAAADRAPEDPERRRHLALLLARAGHLTEAEAALRTAMRLVPQSSALLTDLARLLLRAGKAPDALAAARRAYDLAPRNPQRALVLAQAALAANDIGAAEEAARRTLTLDPRQPNGHLVLSAVLAHRNDLDGARASARQALALEPSLTRALRQVGRLAVAAGDYEEAEAAFIRGAALEPAVPGWGRMLVEARRRKERAAVKPS